ncbi:hypothetical protein [Chryseobacterium sp. MYb328]|uniref:hypothetical protein n=1 Tax=Chryseobacterium sp. MYb328 TaxID=2745231 RepID=UPI00309E7099
MEIKKILCLLVFVLSFLSCKKEPELQKEHPQNIPNETKSYQLISYKNRILTDNNINIFEYNDLKISLEYDRHTFLGYGTKPFSLYQSFYDLDSGDLDLWRYDEPDTKSKIFFVELDNYSSRQFHIYVHQNNHLYYLGENNIDLSKIIENVKNIKVNFDIRQADNGILIESIVNNKSFSTLNYKLEKPLNIYKEYDDISEYIKTGKDISQNSEQENPPHKISKNEFFSINSDRDGIIEVTLNRINKKFVNTKVLEGNPNCPDTSLDNIVLKNNYFTIEKYNCTDKYYLKEYITFKFDKDLLLHKYSIEFTDRHDPDKSIPNKNYTSKDFGNVKFENVDREFLINLLNK